MNDTGPTTRERILCAAIARFSRSSYEDTGLRDIADDVQVDVSYVHRCFGSKKALFTAALTQTLQASEIFAGGHDTFGDQLAAMVMQGRRNPDQDGRPLDIIVSSLSSREAKPILREALVESFIEPLTQKFPDVPRSDIGLALAFLLGVAISATVLELEVFAGMLEDDKRALLAQQLKTLFSGPAEH